MSQYNADLHRRQVTSPRTHQASPAGATCSTRWGYLLYGGHVIDSALVEQMIKNEQHGAEWWYGLGTSGWVRDGQTFLGHDGDIATYHGNLMMATADNVSIAVLVPAPARNAIEAEVPTFEVPDLLLEALRQRGHPQSQDMATDHRGSVEARLQ